MRITTLTAASLAVTVALLGSGCTSAPAPAVRQDTPPAGPWVVDHLDGKEDDSTGPASYTAFCTPAASYSRTTVADEDDVRPVAITKEQFLRMWPGHACPDGTPPTEPDRS